MPVLLRHQLQRQWQASPVACQDVYAADAPKGQAAGARRRRLRCQASPTAADRPPYKQLSVPAYSLSTQPADESSRATMNIVTYASPVALQPPVYALGLYKSTQSAANWRVHRRGLLQILRQQHAELVQLLGETSAQDVDKFAELAALGFETVERLGYSSLADCAGVMELQQMGELVDAGDHEVALCSVGRTENVAADGDVLYTDFLRDRGYI